MSDNQDKLTWTHKHLLGLKDLSRQEIEFILDTAKGFEEISTRSIKKCRRGAARWW